VVFLFSSKAIPFRKYALKAFYQVFAASACSISDTAFVEKWTKEMDTMCRCEAAREFN